MTISKHIIDWDKFSSSAIHAYRHRKAAAILNGKRYGQKHAARECGLVQCTVFHALRGDIIATNAFMRPCLYIGRNPNDFLIQDEANKITKLEN